ncbi:MAG: hypothetical protein JW955_00435 [Sedimentisphaerales bacterium]|nr:hypothetical protein [Sedimentisphaerales bacterium]
MVNLVVATTVAGSPGRIMQMETFEQVMAALVEMQGSVSCATEDSAFLRQREATLHVDSPKAQPHLEQMTARLQENGFSVSVYVHDGPLANDTAIDCGWRTVRSAGTGLQPARTTAEEMPHALAPDTLLAALPSPDVATDALLQRVSTLQDLETVTIGVGRSRWDSGPQWITPADHPVWAAKVIEIASALTDVGVKTSFACGLPLCLFSRRQLGQLVALKVSWPIAWCAPQFHVEPDGEVRHCSRLTGPRRIHISDRRPFEQLATLANRLAPMKAFCGRADSSPCRSLATRACGGGCLAHLLTDWQGMPVASALPQAENAMDGR